MPLHIEFDWRKCQEARVKGLCKRTDSGLYPCQFACKNSNGINLILETLDGNLYTCVQCSGEQLPCVHYTRYENPSYTEFLERASTNNAVLAPLCGVDAIEINRGVKINPEECVSCLLCGAYCPINAIVFDEKLKAHLCTPASCTRSCINACKQGAISLTAETMHADKFKTIQLSKKPVSCENKEVLSNLKKTDFQEITFPRTTVLIDGIPHIVNFEYFSGSYEIKKLTPWVGNALRFIYSLPPKCGAYEVQLPSPPGSERYPRLDICLIIQNESMFLILESKRNLNSAQAGVINKISKKYRDEVISLVKKYNMNHKTKFEACIPLLVGGEDIELLPEGPKLGFYQTLIDFSITLISASYIWCLLALGLFTNSTMPKDTMQSLLRKSEIRGILKQGAVITRNHDITLCNYKKL